MGNRTASIILNVSIGVMLVCIDACKEPFPSYQEPVDVLVGEVTLSAPDTVDVYYNGITQGYYLNSVMVLKVVVTNVHDDLLQGLALVGGRITLQSFGEVPRILVVPLSASNLRTPPLFGGNLALGPGRKAEFTELWLPYSTDSHIVFEGVSYTVVNGDRVYGPIDFIAFSDVQIFERVQPIRTSPLQFRLVFRVVTS